MKITVHAQVVNTCAYVYDKICLGSPGGWGRKSLSHNSVIEQLKESPKRYLRDFGCLWMSFPKFLCLETSTTKAV